RALHARGHRVTFYEPDAFERQQHRDLEDPWWAKVVVYPATAEAALAALEAARASDVLIKASGVGVFDELLEAAVLDVRRPGAVAVFWDVDAPATLARLRHDPRDPFPALVPQYDAAFAYGGGGPVVRGSQARGFRTSVPADY